MAGLIQGAMGAEQGPVDGMGGAAPQAGDDSMQLDAATVRKGMKLPKGMEAAYDKIIKAGIKVMFDPTTRDETMSFIEESNGDPAKMAEGVTAVVVSLFQQSNETMPPNLIIPAGIELLVHAADVAKAGGMDIPKEAIAEAMSQVVQQILTKFGATPEQMQKLMTSMDSGQQPQGAPAQGA